MVVFPNGKINLGLHITAKRPDGYHTIETVFYPVPFYDVLEILPTPAGILPDNFFSTHTGTELIPYKTGKLTGEDAFALSGPVIPGKAADNLCLRAVELLRDAGYAVPSLQIHLHKAIPTGGGLGGGSSDAVFMLKMLNNRFKLALTDTQLADFALRLGSDCPFFLYNTPCYATGRGEIIEPVTLSLAQYSLLLVCPGIHVSTADAFGAAIPAPAPENLREIIQKPVSSWKELLVNDFEKTVFAKFPVLADIKKSLYDAGAVYAAMSGSGSSLFGIFETDKLPEDLFGNVYHTYKARFKDKN